MMGKRKASEIYRDLAKLFEELAEIQTAEKRLPISPPELSKELPANDIRVKFAQEVLKKAANK